MLVVNQIWYVKVITLGKFYTQTQYNKHSYKKVNST